MLYYVIIYRLWAAVRVSAGNKWVRDSPRRRSRGVAAGFMVSGCRLSTRALSYGEIPAFITSCSHVSVLLCVRLTKVLHEVSQLSFSVHHSSVCESSTSESTGWLWLCSLWGHWHVGPTAFTSVLFIQHRITTTVASRINNKLRSWKSPSGDTFVILGKKMKFKKLNLAGENFYRCDLSDGTYNMATFRGT